VDIDSPPDKDRVESAVLFSLLEEPEGNFRFAVYDVHREPGKTKKWSTVCLITSDQLPASKVLNLDFSKDQMAEWGWGLLETLIAGYRTQVDAKASKNGKK
jgi:hypothetical protein